MMCFFRMQAVFGSYIAHAACVWSPNHVQVWSDLSKSQKRYDTAGNTHGVSKRDVHDLKRAQTMYLDLHRSESSEAFSIGVTLFPGPVARLCQVLHGC